MSVLMIAIALGFSRLVLIVPRIIPVTASPGRCPEGTAGCAPWRCSPSRRSAPVIPALTGLWHEIRYGTPPPSPPLPPRLYAIDVTPSRAIGYEMRLRRLPVEASGPRRYRRLGPCPETRQD